MIRRASNTWNRKRWTRPAGRRRPCLPCGAAKTDTTMKEAIETGRTRLLIMGAIVTLAFGCIAVRLIDLTMLRTAQEPRIARASTGAAIETERAEIVDRNGVILATGLTTASLYANPRLVLDADEAARLIASVLPKEDPVKLSGLMRRKASFVWLRRNLTPEQQWGIHRLGIPGLDFLREEARVYPHRGLIAHVLGTTDIDNNGTAGIELYFDRRLREEKRSFALTLDARVQHIVRDSLNDAIMRHKAIGGVGIVLDITNGEVVSLVSLPDFDNNRPGAATEEQRRNRATLGTYELGSIFKIFTTAMALDSGVVTLSSGYDATHPIKISRFTIRDFHAKGRWLTVPEIFMYSSNIGAAKMAIAVGGATQRDYLGRLGLLTSSPIEVPEVGAPQLPKVWRTINTMTISYGHGIAVSPLQLTSAVAAILNDGIYRHPTLVKRPETARPEGFRVVSRNTSRHMRRLLRLVVERGTGRRAAAPGYLVGGKTGTSEKLSGRGYSRRSLISSFIGAFPMNKPRYVVLAILDEPQGTKETNGYATGGWVAAPVVRRIVERIGPTLGIMPVDEESPRFRRALAINLTEKGHTLASY